MESKKIKPILIDTIPIELSKIEESKRLVWLSDNSDYIDYKVLNPAVELAHRTNIQVSENEKIITYTVTEFLKLLGGKKNFDNVGLKEFICLNNNGKKLNPKPVKKFSIKPVCYSFPLFAAILEKYGILETDYDFCFIHFYDKGNIIPFVVEHVKIPILPSPVYDLSGGYPFV